jgi:hypothetical protein
MDLLTVYLSCRISFDQMPRLLGACPHVRPGAYEAIPLQRHPPCRQNRTHRKTLLDRIGIRVHPLFTTWCTWQSEE